MTTESRRSPDENVIGTVIGHYKVTAVLNQGGMGAVYLAEHPLIGKPAVIKLLLPDLSSHEEMVRRFFNEAKSASAIRHPGIVEIFDFGYHTDGRAYIVMEFLDGQSLADRLCDRGRLSELEAAVLTRSMAGALGAAHAKHIVHRDLKPDNVFLVPDPDMPTGERAKVLDFGIAKLSGELPNTEVSRTRTGALMGTPLYMAPEQCRGAGEVDARADLYSLGCMLYEMLCGQPPFLAEGSGEIIAMQLFAEPVPPREIVPELSAEIDEITLALLAKDPAKRPQTAKAVADALAKVLPRLSSRLSAAVPVPSMTRMRPVVATPRPQAAPMSMPMPAVEPAAAASPSQGVRAEPKPTTLGGSAAHVIPSLPPELLPRSRAPRVAIAGAVLIAGAIAAFFVVKSMQRGDDAKPAATAASPAPTPTPAPPAPTTITLSFLLDPAATSIAIDDAPSALTDGAVRLPRDGRDHALVATAPGYLPRTMTVHADKDQTLSISLAPAPAPIAPVATTTTRTTPPPPTPRGHHVHTTSKPISPPHDPTHKPANPTTSPNGSPIETNL